ncbi:glutamine-hydrolyzing carbamoyl-phosphate synthase small subunit [Bathymodiolus septemdierum thioautotrophic gill symbiont]|uniref:Carbamoyl phosphate synthase small chain n=1 Tax=endosymbiont of Bathymodiolus septemdierum str. Myojin knoll TaxID=1303921 RepID=A0A0P0USL5_9GAMM|nr:glutamine-hydrolyzing carbamoyl-phosphate synthase small subunit [Bathymodiolus septemdierum thioautotrophic gill symbiont]BAS68252.1 carbamoyl-phosphate synthase small subunit [endosymbiont of Bathymodiolus septemdierum str. Myojin knoll]
MSQVTLLATLVLEDGQIFKGKSIGANGDTVGEVVFNTAMTGYQEILTDPSYAQQIVALTYPHIGNTGTNAADEESGRIYASGLIIRDLPLMVSNWRSSMPLDEYLSKHNIVAISDIDTRALTRHLREKGALKGCIITGDNIDEVAAIEKAQAFSGLKNMDLAKVVSAAEQYTFNQGSYSLESGEFNALNAKFKVTVYDYGVKKNILRMLVDRGCDLTVVNAQTPVEEILASNPDGVFLSNGPGDPEPCDYAIKNIQTLLEKDVPMFGICLGHQLLSLASGASSEKMKFGHHGANHPVQDLDTKQVMITSQNHGFAVSENNMPANLKITHRSLFDGSIQGVRVVGKKAFGFQGHPEASPGPRDMSGLFDDFIKEMEK